MSNLAPERLAVTKVEVELPVHLHSSGFTTALARLEELEVVSEVIETSPPAAISLKIPKTPLKTFSYQFPQSPEQAKPRPANQQQRSEKLKKPARGKFTRIKPPGDIVKLKDRLFYLLQPPLEIAIAGAAGGELAFPFEPFPYQMEGIAFLYSRYSAVLADEMGLGKTMQAVTTIRLLLRSGKLKRVLLVCPKPLVTNWQREFALWAPETPVAAVEGDQARRRWYWEKGCLPVTIANYESLMRDERVLEELGVHFDLVVLDEAQRIKNRNSTTSQVVRKLDRTRSWALTGTPVENSPEDLIGIFEFLSPGYLNSHMNARKLGEAAGEYVLRRTKEMVLEDLPPKLFRDEELALTPQQQETYERAEQDGVLKLSELGNEITIQHVFELVLRLKQICNFDPGSGASCKMERLAADMEEIAASGQKAIVFSQWVKTIGEISGKLAPYNPLEYHGRIPSNRRDAVIDEFKHDPSRHVLLMSYGAGSVGLNLQFCQYVFLFDRWWNPAVEDQAINRAHRIGAAGPVTVTRMLTLGTIEQRINEVLEQKRELFNTIFSGSTTPSGLGLSQQEIFGLFGLNRPQKKLAA